MLALAHGKWVLVSCAEDDDLVLLTHPFAWLSKGGALASLGLICRTLPTVKQHLPVRILPILGKGAVTIALAWLVIHRIEWQELVAIFQQARPGYLVAAVLVYASSFLVSTLRSGLYLSNIGITLGFASGLRLYFLGVVANLALPGGIGGDGYKLLRLKHAHEVPAKAILSAFLFERLSGLWAIAAWLVVLSGSIPALPVQGWALGLWFALANVPYVILLKKFFPTLARSFLLKHGLSLAIQGLVSLSVLCILSAQDRPYAPATYLFSFHASTVLSILNIGLSGLGVREFVMGYAAQWLDNDPALAVFTASAFWLVSAVAALPGCWLVWKEGLMPSGRKAANSDQAMEVKSS